MYRWEAALTHKAHAHMRNTCAHGHGLMAALHARDLEIHRPFFIKHGLTFAEQVSYRLHMRHPEMHSHLRADIGPLPRYQVCACVIPLHDLAHLHVYCMCIHIKVENVWWARPRCVCMSMGLYGA